MKERTTIRRPILLEEWQIEKTESWLEAMAAHGWWLQSMGTRFAVFRKGEPAILRYRCDVDTATPISSTDSLWLNRAQWERVCTRTKTSIYCTKDLSLPEPHSDNEVYAASLKKLNDNPVFEAVFTLAAIAFFVYFYSSNTGMFRKLLLGSDPIFLALLPALYRCPMAVCGYFHILSMKKKLMAGQPIQHNVPYQRTRSINAFSFTAFILLIVVMMFQGIVQVTPNYAPIPKSNLDVMQISDIYKDASFVPDNAEDQYYCKLWSITVPQQIELRESGVLKGTASSDGSPYTPDLTSQRYWALTPGLARLLAQNLAADSITVEVYDGHEGAGAVPYLGSLSGFDGLWGFESEDGRAHEVIALQGNTVYHIDLTGANTTVDLVTLLKKKIASEN
jgi:hypothetical protein